MYILYMFTVFHSDMNIMQYCTQLYKKIVCIFCAIIFRNHFAIL